MTQPSLDELRKRIDEIDDHIHDLIMERAEVVSNVAAAKGITNNELPIRPAREADMLRRLKSRHKGPFPFVSLARMWQEMIAAFTQIQNSYSIAVYVDENHQAIWDMARDQFGAQTPLTAHGSIRDTLNRVFEGTSGVAVLPKPTEKNSLDWWTGLLVPNAPKIIGHLPFSGTGSLRGEVEEVFAVADIPLAPTGDDCTMLVVETGEQLSRDGLQAYLKAAGLQPFLDTVSVGTASEGWLHLVELDGFIEADHPAIEKLEIRDSVMRTHIIGYYAKAVL
ncbi:chorismate mutase [Curvivirga aplysinae]|uniref:chorismate mutase n=1 Tax=Curvivirga aplysinae TaxID=2529852 RepID=UPI0012BD3D8B|nr:chorismate mutase [Curvivirga aplysinae]MTI08516.1 chorismate mutase [Curvivirga aplysinae]